MQRTGDWIRCKGTIILTKITTRSQTSVSYLSAADLPCTDDTDLLSLPTFPHTGFHPNSYSQGVHFPIAGLDGSSSASSASLGMSVSPPHWPPNNNALWGQSGGFVGGTGSFAGSIGALGTSFGQDRDRELEARYVKDFACCGRQLNGLHELLEQ